MYKKSDVVSKCLEYFDGDKLASDVWMKKYALKDDDGNFFEKTPDDMHKRLAKEFARIEKKYTYPLTEEEIYSFLKDFKYIVPQGSPMSGIGNNKKLQSLSNCVVITPPDDTISSIMNTAKNMANLFKRRAGTGTDLSNLRPDGAKVNNSAGTSSGAWSFANLYSHVTRMIGQGGRRGALMLTMDIRHPDIEKFITSKTDKTKLTGANISVKITNDFMKAVRNDENFELKFPVESDNPSFSKIVKAKDVWNLLVETSTNHAEPGILMWDNVTETLPAHDYPNYKTVSTNPCGELPLSSNDSCRLISINLKHFVVNSFEKNAFFDIEKFKEIVRVGTRLSDDLVELELEKLEKIIEKSDEDEGGVWKKLYKSGKNGRRIGLGTHGLADCLSRLNCAYGDEKSIKKIKKIYSTLKNVAYDSSVEMADERGTFPDYDEKYEGNVFVKNLDVDIQERMKKYGRRNISLLTCAPTGSVSILSQTSSGVEPVFKNSYTRRRKLNSDETKYDFVDEDGEKFINYTVHHKNIQEYIKKIGDENLPDFFIEASDVDTKQRVDVQAVLTENTDHSISSTINLPKGTTSETISDIYMYGWEKKLKGLTIYVDGSRGGVLVSEEKNNFHEGDYITRPDELECDIHHRFIDGDKYVVLVGLLDDNPYEVFAGMEDKIQIPKKYVKGVLTRKKFKTKSNRYDLQIDDDGMIKDVVDTFDNPNNSTLGRMISLSLRYGGKISHVVEQLQQTHKESSMNCFSRVISRVLKEYIKDGTKHSRRCPECGNDSVVYEGGCSICKECGYSACM